MNSVLAAIARGFASFRARRGVPYLPLACAAALLASTIGCQPAAPPSGELTNDDIQEMYDELMSRFADLPADATQFHYETAAAEVFGRVHPAQYTVEQLQFLANEEILPLLPRQPEIASRLTEAARQKTPEGAQAATLLFTLAFFTDDDASLPVRYERALEHPALSQAMQTGACLDLLTLLQYLGPEQLDSLGEQLPKLNPLLTADLREDALQAGASVVESLVKAERLPQVREELRARLASIRREQLAAIAAVGPAESEQANALRDEIERQLAVLNGAYYRGQLLHQPAPEMEFVWCSDPLEAAAIGDLRGQVVVLDFWATWCTPCVRSFPHVRALQERYAGLPVKVIGVCSFVSEADEGDDATLAPLRAQILQSTRRFAREKNMTWSVAFTQDDACRPEFGITGIPHVAIVDAQGRVRHNGLHPAADPQGMYTRIDALLTEAGHVPPRG